MADPFFSIVIPTYNQGKYLEKCIISCLNQTYKNYEIIIIDNNSTDSTNEILKKYEKKVVIKKIDNQGVISKSRNLAHKIAKGNWIAQLDTDDYFSPEKFEKTKDAILNNSFDVFINSEWIIDQKKNSTKVWFFGNDSKNFYKDLIKYGNCLTVSGSVIRKDFLEKKNITYNENDNIKTIGDYDLWLRIAREGGKFFFYNKPLGFHLFHSESVTSKSIDIYFFSLKNILENHYKSNWINKEDYFFALINLKVLETIGDSNLNYFQKNYYLLKYFIKNPIMFINIMYRILKKQLKKEILNIIYFRLNK